jgi:[ribosomal protein S5]-alanine N-acetyltransferase
LSDKVLDTQRLTLRRLSYDDAEFILRLLNDPDFIRFIGDKGVRTLEDARGYLRTGPLASYERFGFGLFRVDLKESGEPIGMCGLLKREVLADVDIGFAYLPEHRAKGYAFEAASAVVSHAYRTYGLTRLAGVTKPDNIGSMRVLEKLGLRRVGTVRIAEDGPEDNLFVGAIPAC